MEEEAGEEIGTFVYGIRVIRKPDGNTKYQYHKTIKNLPLEIVIMQISVFLNDLKKQYHNKYSGKSLDL